MGASETIASMPKWFLPIARWFAHCRHLSNWWWAVIVGAWSAFSVTDTRLTLAFSKKRENFEAAVGLHFAYYNFVKRHNTLRCTPAMAAGVTGSFWSVGELLEAAA